MCRFMTHTFIMPRKVAAAGSANQLKVKRKARVVEGEGESRRAEKQERGAVNARGYDHGAVSSNGN